MNYELPWINLKIRGKPFSSVVSFSEMSEMLWILGVELNKVKGKYPAFVPNF